MKKQRQLIIGLTLLLTFSTTILMAQNVAASAAKGKSSPFLIVGKLPHLTKLLMQQWDNPQLNLSAAQKEKLLVIRKRTIGGIKQRAPQIATFEKEVVEGTLAGKTPAELSASVESIARLKAETTMLHIRCIYETNTILTAEQKVFLTP